jgi:hypothetical protein
MHSDIRSISASINTLNNDTDTVSIDMNIRVLVMESTPYINLIIKLTKIISNTNFSISNSKSINLDIVFICIKM